MQLPRSAAVGVERQSPVECVAMLRITMVFAQPFAQPMGFCCAPRPVTLSVLVDIFCRAPCPGVFRSLSVCGLHPPVDSAEPTT